MAVPNEKQAVNMGIHLITRNRLKRGFELQQAIEHSHRSSARDTWVENY